MTRYSIVSSIKVVDKCIDPSQRHTKGSLRATTSTVDEGSKKPQWSGSYHSSGSDRTAVQIPGHNVAAQFPALWGGRGNGPNVIVPDRLPTVTVPCDSIWRDGQREVFRVQRCLACEKAELSAPSSSTTAAAEKNVDGRLCEVETGAQVSYQPETFRCNVVRPATFLAQPGHHVSACSSAGASDVMTAELDSDSAPTDHNYAVVMQKRRKWSGGSTSSPVADSQEKAAKMAGKALFAKEKLHRACRVHYPHGALGLKESPYGDPGDVYGPVALQKRQRQAWEGRRLRGEGYYSVTGGKHLFGSHVLQSCVAATSVPSSTSPDTIRVTADGWRPCLRVGEAPADHFRGGVQLRDEEGVRKNRLYYM